MKTSTLLVGLLVFTLFLMGCSPQSICKEPYLEYKKGDCCLDSDNNGICDQDEDKQLNEPTEKIIIQAPEKESCPFECCLGIDFKRKSCNSGYECKNSKCEIIDSDSDGLGDNEEKSLGTNPKIFDTDGDGLSDFQEVKTTKTNPLNKNTDEDRLDDKDDPEPLKTNSAELKIESEEILPTIEDIAALIDKIKSIEWWIEQLSQAQTKDVIVRVSNVGDDYTDGFSFDVLTYVVYSKKERDGLSCVNEEVLSKDQIDSQNFRFNNKINVGDSIQETIAIEVPMVTSENSRPEICNELQLCTCTKKIFYRFDNIKYDKY